MSKHKIHTFLCWFLHNICKNELFLWSERRIITPTLQKKIAQENILQRACVIVYNRGSQREGRERKREKREGKREKMRSPTFFSFQISVIEDRSLFSFFNHKSRIICEVTNLQIIHTIICTIVSTFGGPIGPLKSSNCDFLVARQRFLVAPGHRACVNFEGCCNS